MLAYHAANSLSVALDTDGLNYFNAFLKSSNLIALISLVSLIAINYSVVSSLTGDIAASLITACRSEHEYPSVICTNIPYSCSVMSSLASFIFVKIRASLAGPSGSGMKILLVNRLKAASSRSNGRFVAARTRIDFVGSLLTPSN